MTINIPYDYNANICEHRLPCGICRILMAQCPKYGVQIKTLNTGTHGTVTYTDSAKVKLDKE